MGKFCLAAVSLSHLRRLIGCVLLLILAGFPAHAASNHASAVLHIQITVVPTVQTATSQPSSTSPTGSVTYNLQPATTPKMTSLVTIRPISTSGDTQNANRSRQSTKRAVLRTTTVIVD